MSLESLQAPNLDTRTFADLVKEAQDRIPRFTPDWTNLNDSDPGMTIVKLQAWLTETLLYEVNRLPELNYIKFLQLLNVAPIPAKAATTELQFTLKKLDRTTDPLKFFIPNKAQLEADDPDLDSPVIFETDSTLTVLNAMVATIIAVNNDDASPLPLSLVTTFDSKKAILDVNHSFYPFGENPSGGEICYVGILLRPHRKPDNDYSQDVFPAGELDVYISTTEVFEEDPDGNTISGPLAQQSLLPHEIQEQQDSLTWEVYVGTNHETQFTTAGSSSAWQEIVPPVDETGALSRSGHIRPSLPEDISRVSLRDLPRSFWEDLGLKKPPVTISQLIADLQDPDLFYDTENVKDIPWDQTLKPGTAPALLDDLACDCENLSTLITTLQDNANSLTLANITNEDWLDLEVGYGDPAVPEFSMAWLRVRLTEDQTQPNTSYTPHPLNNISLNTVSATAAVTRVAESLGTSDGRPAQTFQLNNSPILFTTDAANKQGTPDIELAIKEADEETIWQRVDDFFATNSQSQVYVLDVTNGKITFGDGIFGRIPVAGATITAKHYRYGGGLKGNVGANTITKIKSSLPNVDAVTNPRAASGGSAAETLERAKLRAPHELKVRDRAVTAEDFAFLAKHTPGVAIHTAVALARRAINTNNQTLFEKDGAVTVVVLPTNTQQETPQPTEAQLSAISDHLNCKRLITTELFITGPNYTQIEKCQLDVKVTQRADLQFVSDEIKQALLHYFHPLTGGDQGEGWPFGENIYFGNIYNLLLTIADVKRVINLAIKLENTTTNCIDYIPVAEGHLLHLRADAINLQVSYDRGDR